MRQVISMTDMKNMMSMDNFQIDALKEIINIASGNAATALSQILKKRINMDIPVVEIRKFQDVADRLGEADEVVMATLLKVLGDVSGNLLLIVKEKNAKNIAYSLLDEIVDNYDDDMVLSVFQEIGNILGNSFLNAMGSFLNVNLLSSVPYISIDMLFSILSSAYIAANENEDYIIDIGCTLSEEDVEFDLNIFFIINAKALEYIVGRTDNLI